MLKIVVCFVIFMPISDFTLIIWCQIHSGANFVYTLSVYKTWSVDNILLIYSPFFINCNFVWNSSCNVQTGCRVNRATRLCQAESYDYSLNLVINCLDMWLGSIFESCLVSTTEPHEIAQTFLAFKSQAESVRGGNWDHACEKLESMGFINLVSQVSTLKDCVIFSDPGNLNSE